MKDFKEKRYKRSFEDRVLDLRFKNSKERDYLFGSDKKRDSGQKVANRV